MESIRLGTIKISSVEEKRVYEITLHEIEVTMNERILVGTFSAMLTNDEATQGYYLVKWQSESYTM